jgi:sortase A
VKSVATWIARVLLASGLAALGWCAFVLVDGLRYQGTQARRLESELVLATHDVAEADDVAAVADVESQPRPVDPSGLFGRLEIARLGLSVMVAEGVDSRSLRRAAGHIPGTGVPGRTGNIGISAHRDTYFRRLKDIRIGDMISLVMVSAAYRYRVVSTSIVPPSNIEILDPDGGEILTLVTCHPFYYVGAAPNRFIVRAERIN